MTTYNTPDMWDSDDLTAYPRILPKHVREVTLAAVTGAPTYTVGTPLAVDSVSGEFVIWSAGGTNDNDKIKAFLYPRDVDTHATNASLVVVLEAGDIHYDDIELPTGESAADLMAALKHEELRMRGLRIKGLSGIGTTNES